MVASNFDRSLKLVLAYEGGWTNDPHDPGGATMWGIIQREYNAYRARHGQTQQSVRNISVSERDDIYRNEYWNAMGCDALPSGLDFCVFDAAVNSGTGRSAQWLKASGGDTDKFCDIRLAFLQRLSTWRYFGGGWGDRVASVRRSAKLFANESAGPSEEVRWVQSALKQLGADIAVDGYAGDDTEAAIRAYQASHNLVADGIAGPLTLASLKKYTAPVITNPFDIFSQLIKGITDMMTTVVSAPTAAVKTVAQGATIGVTGILGSISRFFGSGILASAGAIATTLAPTTTTAILAALVAIGALISAAGHALHVVGVIKSTNDATYAAIENLLNEISTVLGGKKVVEDLDPAAPATQA